METRKLERRGRYNELSDANKDIYQISEKAKAHMRKMANETLQILARDNFAMK